jgi:hypothetical protein
MAFALGLLAKAGWDLFTRRGADTRRPDPGHGAQIIPLHPQTFPDSVEDPEPPPPPAMPARVVYALQDDPALVEFRNRRHFEAGCDDAVASPDHEELERGTGRLLAEFEDVLDYMTGVRQAEIDDAELDLLKAGQQVIPLAEARLRKTIERARREIEELRSQRDQALNGKGWYRLPLAEYCGGFLRSMNQALDVRHRMR